MIQKMPKVALGTWQLLDPGKIKDIIPQALEVGYKHIDTAQIYFNEKMIGDALKKMDIPREEYWITSKVTPINFKYNTYLSIEKSLEKLQTKYIDAMLLHSMSSDEENLLAYKELIKARENGLIRNIGVSNFTIEAIEKIFTETGEYPKYNQIVASVIQRVEDLEKYCVEKDITLMGYSSIRPYYNPNAFYENGKLSDSEIDVIDTMAKKYNVSPATVLTKYIFDCNYVVLPKTSKVERLVSNFEITKLEINEEDFKVLQTMNKYTYKTWEAEMDKFKQMFNVPDQIKKQGIGITPEADKIFIELRNKMK